MDFEKEAKDLSDETCCGGDYCDDRGNHEPELMDALRRAYLAGLRRAAELYLDGAITFGDDAERVADELVKAIRSEADRIEKEGK